LKAIEKGKLTKAMNNLAILYYEQKKLQEALKYYKTLVDNYGMNENAYNTGLIYSQLKQPKEAIKYFEIALNKAGNKNALYNLGVSYYDLGDKETAKKYLKQAALNGDKDAKLMLDGME
jgi:tetratricopeptide repeat protein